MSCSHFYPGKWVPGIRYQWHDDDDDIKDEFIDGESACVDIDLHRYKCQLCGEVGYYSNRAREMYEGAK